MAIVPETDEDIIRIYGDVVGPWYSARLYAKLVARHPNHLLVRLQGLIDFGPLEVSCAEYFHRSGPGAKPTHTLQRLVRIQLVRYLYHWSFRETEEQLDSNLLLRWFVGYGLLEAVVDHTTLDRFEQWVCAKQHRLYFDAILRQIEAAFPQVREGAQIGDTFACRANAAAEGLVELLRHTSRLALAVLAKGASQIHTAVLSQLDQPQLFGAADERNLYYLSEAERQQRDETTVRGAWQLVQLLQPQLEGLAEPYKTQVSERVADLRKIIGDEYLVQADERGQVQTVVERDGKHKGAYRLGSATDREATYRNHAHDSTLGANISLSAHAATSFICEIQAATGATPDQAGVPKLVSEQRAHRGLCPEKLIYDQAGGMGRTRAEVAKASHGQTQLVARIPPSSVSGRFTPEDFQLLEDGSLQCPAGRVARGHYRSKACDGWLYEFHASTCRACPLWTQCREAGTRSTGPRRVLVSDYQAEIRQARAYHQTPAFADDMRLRPRIERIIFLLTHYDGARRARFRGLHAIDFQVKMAATARNLRTWLLLLEAGSPPPRKRRAEPTS